MADHNQLGQWGEQVAKEYLLTQGYAISGENIRIAGVEIDFIAMKDDMICFVEVKTRSTDFSDPADAVDKRKRARIVRAADTYIRSYDIPLEPRFDLVLVIGSPASYTIEHIPDAFLPSLNNR
ncbi:MAG: YraN family protein [Bacteroides sp.]|nr:YraN family protein [Bacteroides sp.]